MEYKQGTERDQLHLFSDSLDDMLGEENSVRVIDSYVENVDLKKLGFKMPELKTGTPPYRPQLLLKIYMYGYLEKIRSSRKLEKECKRNIELIWLTKKLVPDFKTIADFRKDNREGIKSVFKDFLYFCKQANLLSLEQVGIDGTKMRAQNSQNNIYKRKTIGLVEEAIEKKIKEYLAELDENDRRDDFGLKMQCGEEVRKVVKKLNQLRNYQEKVKKIKKKFEDDKKLETYFATDSDSGFQSDKGKINPGYNIQIAVDDKEKLIIGSEVTNKSNDLEQITPMVEMVQETKNDLEIKVETNALMDAGYYSETEILHNMNKEGVHIFVCDKKEAEEKNKKQRNTPGRDTIPAPGYKAKDFIYDSDRDICICPAGKKLYKTHNNPGKEASGREVFEFQCKECGTCANREKCTTNKRGRAIKISAHKKIIELFEKEMQSEAAKKILSKRKEIVEHPFGTFKRNLGYTYFMQKGLEKVKAELNFMCFTYNFKRVLNSLGVTAFLAEIERQKNVPLATK